MDTEPRSDSIVIPLLPRLGGGLVLRLRVLPTAWLLIAVHLIVTGTRLARSWWWQDDLNLLALAKQPLSGSLLLRDYNGHLVPGTFVVGWLVDHVGSLAWWPAALLVLLLSAGIDVTLLALLRRMFGTRPGILVPLAMYCGTTLTLTSTVWWAAAMQWLPVSLSLVLALYGQVSYYATGRSRYAVVSVAAVVLGLLFFEKALTTTVLLALFAVLYGIGGPWATRPWRLFLARPAYWLAHLGVAFGFVLLYLSKVTLDTGSSSGSAARGVGDYLTLVRYMVLDTFVPSLLGGPFRWWSTPKTTVNAWPYPPLWFALITWLVALAVIVLTVRGRAGAWRAWALLGLFLTMSVGLVARARLDFVGPFIGRDHRYVTDAAVLASICLALALMPMLPGLDKGEAGAPVAGRARERPSTSMRGWPGSPAAGLVVVLLMTVGGVVSGENFMKVWTLNPTQPYFDNLRSSLAASTGPVYLFGEETLPDLVMTPTFEDSRQLRRVGVVLDRRPVFRDWAAQISMVTDDGRIVPATVDAQPTTLPAPACADATGRIVVQLPGAVQNWRWKIQLGYLTVNPTRADVRLGVNGRPVPVEFTERLGNLYLDTEAGPAATLIIDNVGAGSGLCIGTIAIGKELKPRTPS